MADKRDDGLEPFDFPLNGRLITKLDGTVLPDAHFQTLENMRYNDSGIEGVEGMSKVNNTVMAKLKVQNGFFFKKEAPSSEHHHFVQVTNPTDKTSAIYKSDVTKAVATITFTFAATTSVTASGNANNYGVYVGQSIYNSTNDTSSYAKKITAISTNGLTITLESAYAGTTGASKTGTLVYNVPYATTYTLFKALDNDNTCYFSEAPDQSMVICNGEHNYIYSGDEYRCAKLINFDPSDTFSYDYTTQANNNLTTSGNTFVLSRVLSGISTSTEGLWHFDNGLTDSSGNTNTLTGVGTPTYAAGEFGGATGAVALNGTTQYVYRASDSDFDMSDGTWSFDGRFYITSLSAVNPLWYWSTPIKKFTFDTGTTEPAVGSTIYVANVGTESVCKVYAVTVDSGAWATDDAAGTIYYTLTSGDDVDNTKIAYSETAGGGDVICTATGDGAAAGTDYVKLSVTTAGAINFIIHECYGLGAVAGLTFTFAASTSVTASADCSALLKVGQYIYNSTDDAATSALKITEISSDGLTVTLASAYAGTAGAAKVATIANSDVVELTSPTGVVTASSWKYIEVTENGDNWYLFAGDSSSTVTIYDTDTSNTERATLYTGNFTLGYDGTLYYTGRMDEVRFSSTAIHTDIFAVPVAAYSSEYAAHLYIGSTRPISGFKPYISVANATAATIAGYYWSGTAWTTVGTITDGTAITVGTPLAKTGFITFASTVDTAKVKVIEENIAYFYYFVFYSIDAATALSQLTVQCPIQDIVDIWDGVPRQIYSCIRLSGGVEADYTVNAYALDYDVDTADSYVPFYVNNDAKIYAGFNERLSGIKIYMAADKENSNTVALTVDYWNGSAWTAVTGLVDGTSVSGKAMNRTGIVSWDAPAANLEFTRSVANSAKWYYYRFNISAITSANTRIDHFAGLPVQTTIPAHSYPVLWNNRLWLLNDQTKAGNAALGSSYGTVCVFNGTDSGTLLFGGSRGLVAGATLFTRFGGSLYENMIICKNNETYLVDGTSFTGDSSGAGAFVVYQVSGVRGCIAPLTMKACDSGYEVAEGVTKHVLIWLSNSGVVMFDSNSIIEVSNDIEDRMYGTLDKKNASKSAGFYVAGKGEYHILVPILSSGASVSYLTEEWVYDTIRKRWYQVKRSTKYLWSGFNVEDEYGNQYTYGGTGDGYIELLESGTTFDGVDIVYKFRLNDSLLTKSWARRKEMRSVRLVGICKTTTTATVTLNHYADGSTTASTPTTTVIPNNKTDRRFYKFQRSVSFRGNTHSLEFTTTTNNEYGGFDPLYVSGLYKVIDYDMEDV